MLKISFDFAKVYKGVVKLYKEGTLYIKVYKGVVKLYKEGTLYIMVLQEVKIFWHTYNTL